MSRNFELSQQALSRPAKSEVSWVPRIAEREPTQYQPSQPTVVVSRPEPEWVRAMELLKQRWKAGAAFAVVVISAVTLGTFLMKPVYEPVARLQIDPPGNEIFSIQEKSNVENGTEYINTQANNLKNDGFLLEVIRKLNLAAVPEFGGPTASDSRAPSDPTDELTLSKPESSALKTLQKQLAVTRDAGSRLLQVSVASHDPRRAAQITNSVVDLFVEREYRMRHDSIMESSVSLQKQLADIWERMEESNRVLAAFQKNNDLAIVGDNQSTFSEQFAELNRQYMQAEADRIQLQSYLNNFDGQSANSLPQVNSNPVIQQLTQKLAEARAELSQTLAVYGKNHPKARELENKTNELDAQLQKERASILRGLQNSYSADKARSQLMKSARDSTTRQLAMMTRYNELRKEADANTQLYNVLYAKIKEAGIAAESKSSPIRIVERARVLDTPTRPHRLMNVAVGTFGGIFGGLVLVFLLEAFSTKIRTLEDVRQCIGTSPVSMLPEILSDEGSNFSRLLPFGSGASEHPLFLMERPSAPESQALRALYSSLRFIHGATLPQVLVVASPHSGEGKTTLSVNLAVALAEQGEICLVDADMRKPDIAQALGLRSDFGLSDVLRGAAMLDEALIPVPTVPNLTVLSAGAPSEDAAKLIFSDSLSEVIHQLRGRFRFVLIDSPPVVPFADARVLSVLADGVILVGRSGVTKRGSLSRAVELLNECHSAPILQTVLNAAEYPSVDYQRYYGTEKNSGHRKRTNS